MALSGTIGIVGAGTMGAGIAQLSALAGARTLLHDALPAALAHGMDRVETALERETAKGRLSPHDAAAARKRVEPVEAIADLAPCDLVIEAAPERLELKRELFARLAEVVGPDCVLATNTSSLSVTEIAASVPKPERVVGLHFFNPAPVMRLVEVVAGEQSHEPALELARRVAQAMGKRVVHAADIAGFLVNRCNRPYSLESLHLLEERVAGVEQIDRIARLGGGFRMGPFEFMDLVGVDTNHAVAESFLRRTYGEPRYRPSPLGARLVAAGRLGRKSGRGWYTYGDGAAHRPPDPAPLTPGGGEGRAVIIVGELRIARELLAAARGAGWKAHHAEAWPGAEPAVNRILDDDPWLVVDCVADGSACDGPRAILLHRSSLHQQAPAAVGFHALPPFDECRLIEMTSTPRTPTELVERLVVFIRSLGRHVEHVRDAPGLVLGRLVAQLINEAMFLIGEGNGTSEDIDAAMVLGVNHPRGPVAWSEAIGVRHVLALLDGLHDELRDDRYRAAPLLRRRAAIDDAVLETGCTTS
jgi:3-hydroxybutyryl-CoA dehydrogenase